MFSLNVLYMVVMLSLVELSFALPTDTRALKPRQAVPADTIDKYTVQYFLSVVDKAPPSSSCIFYTATLTAAARQYAEDNSQFTIWGVWPCGLYDRSQDDTNPLRDILEKQADGSNTADGQTYFENMSAAYAALCSGTAYVMSNTLPNVNEQGIWGRIEKPTLQKTGNPGGQVDVIEACDTNMSNCLTPAYWTRATPIEADTTEPEKRQTSTCPLCAALPNQCYTPQEQADIFSDIDPLW